MKHVNNDDGVRTVEFLTPGDFVSGKFIRFEHDPEAVMLQQEDGEFVRILLKPIVPTEEPFGSFSAIFGTYNG